jgi:hypothetical protein
MLERLKCEVATRWVPCLLEGLKCVRCSWKVGCLAIRSKCAWREGEGGVLGMLVTVLLRSTCTQYIHICRRKHVSVWSCVGVTRQYLVLSHPLHLLCACVCVGARAYVRVHARQSCSMCGQDRFVA